MQHEMNNPLGLGAYGEPFTQKECEQHTAARCAKFREAQERSRIRFAGILTILFLLALHVIRAMC
jgi:hypothetical protein